VLAADDEKHARERLRRLLTRSGRVELVACCSGGADALDAMRRSAATATPIHLLFLDVQMPEVDGFAVVAKLVDEFPPHAVPAVVFVTAHDEYALRAFEAQAVDYLLKPFSDERFSAALDRAIRQIRAGHAHALVSRLQLLLGTLPRPPVEEPQTSHERRTIVDRILVKGPHRVRLLPVDQISWIAADGMYVQLHTRDGAAHLHRALLGSLEGVLDERRFVRVHRSTIVNIDMVEELRQDAHGDHVIVLRDHTELRVGRRFRERLQARLGQPL
jgi:two-component system LytT family response regulator